MDGVNEDGDGEEEEHGEGGDHGREAYGEG